MWETDELAQKYISIIYKNINDIDERIDTHIQNVNMLTGTPVKKLTGNEFCDISSDSELCRQVIDYYYQQHNLSTENDVLTISSVCGNVQIDLDGINNCWRHNKSKLKGISFAAIEEVLTNGCMILPWGRYKTSDKKQATSMLAAPLSIQDTKYICVFVLISNAKKRIRLYANALYRLNDLLCISRGACDTNTAIQCTNAIHYASGELSTAKVLLNFISAKRKDLINPNEIEMDLTDNKQQNENYTQYNTMKNNNKALYESIMKDVAKVVKRKLNEDILDTPLADTREASNMIIKNNNCHSLCAEFNDYEDNLYKLLNECGRRNPKSNAIISTIQFASNMKKVMFLFGRY